MLGEVFVKDEVETNEEKSKKLILSKTFGVEDEDVMHSS
jgi:hypothetical protein